MTRIPLWLMVIIAVVLAVLGGRAISAQDKYTVQVPGGLALSDCRGYEDCMAQKIKPYATGCLTSPLIEQTRFIRG